MSSDDGNTDIKIAIDIGGTFTDVVVENGNIQFSQKVLTTHEAPEQGVMQGVISALGQNNVEPSSVGLVIHGTTLATNALIERKGAKTALITTEGFRDSVEMAYEHRFEQYDVYMERPAPLAPREWRYTVPERIAADGAVLLELNDSSLESLVARLEREKFEAAAICFLHSYVNPDHERRARDILSRALPDLSISISSDVCPEIREYDRLSTTLANAYVKPLMAGYLRKLEAALGTEGINAPLLLMMSNGGVTTVGTATEQPIRLVESGPAGGAILALNIAAENGLEKVLAFDMGGTTAKITLIDDYKPQLSRTFEVARMHRFLKGSGLPMRIPVIDMVEIGAGGGSIVRLDEINRITIGPDSTGSEPGPACYNRGGQNAAVTDADVVLNRISIDRFAGGKVSLRPELAQAAIEEAVGKPLAMSTLVAAAGVAEIVDENMANAARVHAIESGKDTADRTLIAFGGAAPLHASRMADKLGIDHIIVPSGAGVGSAVGFLKAPISYEVVRTSFMALDDFDADRLNVLFAELRAEAETVVRLGAPDAELLEVRTAFIRYRGQGHEITVDVPCRTFSGSDSSTLKTAFEKEYTALYGRIIPNLSIEALSWTLSLSTATDLPETGKTSTETHYPSAIDHREMFDVEVGETVNAEVHDRKALEPGALIHGPAIIVEDETATVVSVSFDARINDLGQITLVRKQLTNTGA